MPSSRPRRLLALLLSLTLLGAATADARTLRLNITADPAMVDPITFSELIAGDIIANVYEGFTGLDADGNVIPALAERWSAHDDNRGFRFELRKGVKFHSGRELTAADVKWSFEQLLIPGNKGGLNVKYLEAIEGADDVKAGKTTDLVGVKVVDDHTVDVRFTRTEVLFPIYPLYIMDSGIVAEHGADWHTKVSAGTGPFRFVHWKRGQEVRLAAHEGYWGGAPAIDDVAFLVVPSDDTAISMYEAGELDLVYLDVTAGRRMLKDTRFKDELMLVPAAQIQYLGLNQTKYAPFKDRRVREAICIAIDRDGMVAGLYGGAAFPLYGQVTKGVAGYNPDLRPIPYDPERAKALLAEAGYPGGQGLPPVKVTSTAPRKTEIAYYANQLKTALGMPVEVEVVERGTHIKAMNAGEVAFFPWGWTAGYPDGLYFLEDVWYGPSRYNRSRWSNAEFDALIEKARETADEKARYALYHQAEQILLDDWGTCPTTVRMQIAARKPNVHGVALTPFRFLPFAKVRIE
ncbi:MAG: ABC transporter substrate-binding protein [Ectothiorhodospiraceae bacterium]|nr:ABC transporter substrate-binding protein [Chromatiales bacterium]MCP5154366.1 ABC transporter substrate-binding protein [Ectothiorhodospiraceae bacterium]